MSSASTSPKTLSEASAHLYEAFTHRFGPLDLSAHQPIVRAISDYAAAARSGDEEKQRAASSEIYVAITHQFGKIDLGARDQFVIALSEYGAAAAAEGRA